ncbi:hypothetical protein K439DRAFT_1409792 [Ramaria rubella]|nr:hypothetical protein K439DRAFT_1409792 [Ramaria rubella]
MSLSTPPMDQLFVNIPSSIHAPPQTPLPLLSHPNPSWNAVLDQDEYDDDVPDLPPSSPKKDKQIRRRSSKACDQCRKSKCKCERPGGRDEPCKNCVLLGTPCTFLGPSRKRGPPKGYIDAIESRLHQMEALLGTLISSNDIRARSLIDDLTGDPLARDILSRVDESPFGTRGKIGDGIEDRASRIVRTTSGNSSQLPFASPSTEWQEHLKERMRLGSGKTVDVAGPPRLSLVTDMRRSSLPSLNGSRATQRDRAGQSPRQRRRLDSSSPHARSLPRANTRPTPSLSATSSSSSDDEEIASAVGQLSLNEDSQVRYHGQASGLHILGQSDRLDKRNEGGIWRFPKAGVWPRSVGRGPRDQIAAEWEARARFPSAEVQNNMLELYFAYVHPVLPVMQKAQFWREFRGEPDPDYQASPSPPRSEPVSSDHASPGSNSNLGNGENRVPTLLLLAMYAIAARYTTTAPLPPSEGDMWNAGDEYLDDAKRILNQTYASSRPSTCQALLLLSYREIGIGAMAQAWLYVGMAVRMAQDLGMHRSADKWQRTGAELFSETERQVRKRIWFSCVIMDKYVSTYIGRPLSIFERDFDTPYPNEDPAEEMELWQRHGSACPGEETLETEIFSAYVPVATHLISCFNASARLSGILSNIVETIYAVHAHHSRHAECTLLEQRLDKWYIELPDHLQFNYAAKATPPPHVLTMHMQYWCSVLLLHRPFIRRKSQHGMGGPSTLETDAEANASCRKAFDLCAMAAAKISNIVEKYQDNFCLQRCPAFLTYYVFSASIMHMTTLSVRRVDVQAALGLQRCMDALQTMNVSVFLASGP